MGGLNLMIQAADSSLKIMAKCKKLRFCHKYLMFVWVVKKLDIRHSVIKPIKNGFYNK